MTDSTSPVIETRGLTKRYVGRTVVDGLDIEVPPGVVAGFVGPNGAGKTTTLRMLLGLVRPTAGDGRVLGVPLSTPGGYLPQVGAMIESPAFYPGLSGERNLAVLATLAGHDLAEIPALLARVELDNRGRDPYKSYSIGMKQRLGIAAALLGGPRLLVLDEPANGLDPTGIRQMRELLRSLTAGGATVFVSSHVLAEVEQVCDWLVMIDRGRRVFQGPTAQLLAAGADELVLGCEHATDLPRLATLLEKRGLPAIRRGDHLRVGINDLLDHTSERGLAGLLADINRAAAAEDFTLAELTVARSNLEDRYATLMTEGAR